MLIKTIKPFLHGKFKFEADKVYDVPAALFYKFIENKWAKEQVFANAEDVTDLTMHWKYFASLEDGVRFKNYKPLISLEPIPKVT